MGLLVDGVWKDQWYDTKSTGGKFVRSVSQFRNWITKTGDAGPTGVGGFKAESNRYHLYVGYACPWASRVLMMRKLKGLEEHISVSIVHPIMLENGWTFEQTEDTIPDTVLNKKYLYEVYASVDPTYTGRVTIPVLYDKQSNTIVNNESSEILRMFNTAFNGITGNNDDYYPESLRQDIDRVNDYVYDHINNGVYKAGFSTTQEVYDQEVANVFEGLEYLENVLASSPYIVGNQMTEADIRLFTTLIRFDPVYFGHFKCNIKALKDYPNLFNYTKRIYNLDGVKETVNFDHIKTHYYGSHLMINPTGIVPKGPDIDWSL